MASANSQKPSTPAPTFDEDELFLDQLKDSFCFFFAATVTLMELIKHLKTSPDKRPG